MQPVWLDGPDPRGPIKLGDWVSSAAYQFSGARVVMDLGEDLVRLEVDRVEMTARRQLVWPATEQEITAAKDRLAAIEAERGPRYRPPTPRPAPGPGPGRVT